MANDAQPITIYDELAAAEAELAVWQERVRVLRERAQSEQNVNGGTADGAQAAQSGSTSSTAAVAAAVAKVASQPTQAAKSYTTVATCSMTEQPYSSTKNLSGLDAQGKSPVPPQPVEYATYAAAPVQSGTYYQQPYVQAYSQPKDHVAAGLLAILFGWLGAHKFYLGYNSAGFIMLGISVIGGIFTFTLAFWVIEVIAIVEGIMYLTKSQSDFEQVYVLNERDWF